MLITLPLASSQIIRWCENQPEEVVEAEMAAFRKTLLGDHVESRAGGELRQWELDFLNELDQPQLLSLLVVSSGLLLLLLLLLFACFPHRSLC